MSVGLQLRALVMHCDRVVQVSSPVSQAQRRCVTAGGDLWHKGRRCGSSTRILKRYLGKTQTHGRYLPS